MLEKSHAAISANSKKDVATVASCRRKKFNIIFSYVGTICRCCDMQLGAIASTLTL